MKTKFFQAAIAAVSFLAAGAQGQVTTETAYSGGINEPYGVTEDASGNVYMTDAANNRIVRIDYATHTAATLAGTGSIGFRDGTFNVAQFSNPQGLLLVNLGGITGLLVTDSGNNAIRFVRLSDGYVSTLAGRGLVGPATDAAGLNATFHTPLGLDQDGSGNVYIADAGNNAIRVMNLNDPAFGVTNLQVTSVTNYSPAAVAFMGTNQLWVADAGSDSKSDNTVKLFALSTPTVGAMTTFMGANIPHNSSGYSNSLAGGTNVRFKSPCGLLWVNGIGLLIADSGNNVIRLATNNPVYGTMNYSVTTYAGNGTSGLVNGSASATEFSSPFSMAVDWTTNAILVADGMNGVIRRVLTGAILPPGPSPYFNTPAGLAVDASGGNVYIADSANNVVHRLNLANNQLVPWLTNAISHPASVLMDTNNILYVLNQNSGNGNILCFDSQQHLSATRAVGLKQPMAFTMDSSGNLFVAEQGGAVRVVDPSGAVNTLATVTNANVSLQGIALFDDGNFVVSDAGNQVLWTINPLTKAVSRLTGQLGVSGSTLGTSNFALLNQPHQLGHMGNNQVVVADTGNNRLVTVTRSGTITNILNSTNGLVWFGRVGDPVAASSSKVFPMVSPVGVAVSSAGLVYASETFYGDIRALTATVAAPQPVNVQWSSFTTPSSLAFDPQDNYLYIADAGAKAVKLLNLNNNLTSNFLTQSNNLNQPVAVLVDSNNYIPYIYVLDQNNGNNGAVRAFDIYGNPYGTLATGLHQPTAFIQDGYGKLIIAEQSGVIRAFGVGVSNVVATITNANVSLQGIALFDDGNIAVSDAGNHVIWLVNPLTETISLLTGQLGTNGGTLGGPLFAQLNQPRQLSRLANNQLVVADYGNNRLVTVTRAGYITNVLNSANASVWFGQSGDPVANSSPQFIPMVQPSGVASANGLVFAAETYFNDVRGLVSPTLSYPTFNPGAPLPNYSYPAGLALNNEGTVLFIADPTNNTISQLDLANNQTTIFLSTDNGISQPMDVALDSSDNVFVLNQGTGGNGSIMEFDRFGTFVTNYVTGLAMPTAMKLTFDGTFYVTEQGGLVQMFNSTGSNTVANITTNVNVQLTGVAVLDNGVIVVSDAGNHVLWQVPAGGSNTNATVFTGVIGASGTNFGSVGTAKLNKPMHLAQALGGLLLIADSGNNRLAIADDAGTISRALNSSSTNVDEWFGLPIDPVNSRSPSFVPMLSPMGLAIGSGAGNNQIVFDSEVIYKDIRGIFNSGIQAPIPPPPAPLNLVATPALAKVTLTWSATSGATNYLVERATSTNTGAVFTTIASTPNTAYTDNNVIGGSAYYYVVVAVNAGGESANSAIVMATPLVPPPLAPRVGWFDYELSGIWLTLLHPISVATFNNDISVAIDPVGTGIKTYYTIDGSTPSATNGMTPPTYADGLIYSQPLTTPVASDFFIKAINIDSYGQVSPITTAEFIFQTANPSINGFNGAQFTVNDVTDGATFWYTTDGTDPTNAPPSIGPVAMTGTNGALISLIITNNTLFKARAFHAPYLPSGVVVQNFSASNFVANTLSFGFTSGEASSDFVASPGQTYYAPVTLTTLASTRIFSMQFNMTVTNDGPNPGPAIAPGAFGFQTMLVKQLVVNALLPVSETFIPIPPMAFVINGTNPPPTTSSVLYGSNWFQNLEVPNNAENLLAVGWLERAGQTNLYNTLKQSLIDFSLAHDDIFPNPQAPNGVIVGGYSFLVPANATTGQTYKIQIGRPSATSDGIGAPGSDVYIATPTNGSTAGGSPLNALKYVTVGQRKYLAGSVYPFHWFNAGDFGSSNLVNADVEQVFQSAIYQDDFPMPKSDFFDAMDSCGNIGVLDSDPSSINNGYYTNAGPYVGNSFTNIITITNYTVYYNTTNYYLFFAYPETITNIVQANGPVYYYYAYSYTTNLIVYPNATNVFSIDQSLQIIPYYNSINLLFDGNDTTINQVAFGDGNLDVCDVFVTFRRSLDPGLTWYRRFWNGGERVADTSLPNVASHALTRSASPQPQAPALPAATVSTTPIVAPQVNFTAGDVQGSSGQTVQVPINATVLGNYPLRLLMLNLSVEPLDGAPELTAPVQFNQLATALGTPYTITSSGNNNFAAVWLNNTNGGITGTATIGTLSITVPANAGPNAAYAIHFDHASASPNGFASFARQTLTGLVTLSNRTNSIYNDGLPDSWRLRWFGTVYNVLSASNACPAGDGVPNWQKYIAGVNPNTAGDFPSLHSTPAPLGFNSAIHWPSVQGTHYVIERANNLFTGPWSILSTNTGTGGDMEFDDTNRASAKFYRVLITP